MRNPVMSGDKNYLASGINQHPAVGLLETQRSLIEYSPDSQAKAFVNIYSMQINQDKTTMEEFIALLPELTLHFKASQLRRRQSKKKEFNCDIE
ncbi:hypothetical protein HHI36_017745, partial [Cryptolaemus montrouzieri]